MIRNAPERLAGGIALFGILATFCPGARAQDSSATQPQHAAGTLSTKEFEELKAQLAGSADHRAAIALLKEKVAAIPNVLTDPAVDVEILEFNLVGPVLAVRPYTHNDNYWQVYFDTNRTIKEALAEGGFPAPTPSQALTITTPGQLAGLAAVAQSTTTPTSVN